MQLYERDHVCDSVRALIFFDLPAGPPNSSLPDKLSFGKEIHPTLPEQLILTELRKQRTSSVVIPVGTTGGSGQFLPATQMVYTIEIPREPDQGRCL